MKKVVGRAYIDMESLQTVVTEIEAVMNDRPLRNLSPNIDDPEPLTPAHLLYGRRITSLPRIDSAIDTECRSAKLWPRIYHQTSEETGTHHWPVLQKMEDRVPDSASGPT